MNVNQSITGKPDQSVGFITSRDLLARIPISRRTLFEWRSTGKIPFVRLHGSKVLFHWPSVEQALLRRQTGGQER
jgi:predicted site-specific integrase-resolvase